MVHTFKLTSVHQLQHGKPAQLFSGAGFLSLPRPSTSSHAASDPKKNYSTALASFFFSLLGATPNSVLTVGGGRVQLPKVRPAPLASPTSRDRCSARLKVFEC